MHFDNDNVHEAENAFSRYRAVSRLMNITIQELLSEDFKINEVVDRNEWMDPVKQWLDSQPGVRLHPTHTILKEVYGIEERNPYVAQNLSMIMYRLGWKPTNRVMPNGIKARGYFRGK